MAITLSTGDKLYYAKVFKVDPGLIAKAETKGIEISYAATSLLIKDCAGYVWHQVPAKPSVIQMAKSGTLGPSSSAAITNQLKIGLEKAMDKGALPAAQFANSVLDDEEKKAAVLKALDVGKALAAKKAVNVIDEIEKAKGWHKAYGGMEGPVAEGPIVTQTKLRDATALLQPVMGTSNGSVYYVVGMFEGLNIAIRRTSSKFSIRAEGNNYNAAKSALAAFGFSLNADYASQHFYSSDVLDMRKCLGALYASVGGIENVKQKDPIHVPIAGG